MALSKEKAKKSTGNAISKMIDNGMPPKVAITIATSKAKKDMPKRGSRTAKNKAKK